MLKKFSDESFIYYDKGNFDEYCVYLEQNSKRKAPRDIEYFTALKELSSKYGGERIYNDFIKIYNRTGNLIDNAILITLIDEIANAYTEDSLEINKIFSIIYLGMIAEERKKFTKLGKRIKRLGMHYLLIENNSAYISANFMRGKNWREIDFLCKERSF